ncbi:MAG: type II secretion system GspH family protein [Planctomycetaceae bacterium]|jgi:prepilin-type N-terminal cleavage/methylation domain-containing protein|nr:type II secretion system GspH family protein [Planctomycetaceae bacterium]
MNENKSAFTLVELLIVVALLGLLAMIILPRFSGSRADAIEPIIQTELASIQRAFFRLKNDCNLQQKHYTIIAKYGVSVLIRNQTTDDNDILLLENWDADRQRGWRGPYIDSENEREININQSGQPSGNITVPTILTPNHNANANNDLNYYRILATDKNNNVLAPTSENSEKIHQLWLIYPHKNINDIITIPAANDPNRKYYRKLIAESE